MGKNNQWSNYTKDELIENLRRVLINNPDVKAKDFGKLGLPSVKTYKNSILKLKTTSMKDLYKYFGLEHKPNFNYTDKKKNHDLDEMKIIALEQGFELLNQTFNSVKEIAHLRCINCGKTKDIAYQYFIYKPTRCLNCTDSPRKYTYKQIKNYIEIESNSGCELLETEESYKEKTKLQPKMSLCKIKFKCHCGNEFEQSFNGFKSGGKQECNECSLGRVKRGYTYEQVKNYIELESKCKLLSTEYKGYHNSLHLLCSCGNDFYRSLSEFKGTSNREGIHTCKLCTGATIQKTTEEVRNDFEEHGIELLSEYINYNSPIKVRYSCGFEIERTYANVIKSKYKCPHCVKSGYGRDTEQLKNEIEDITNGEYTLLSEYKTMNDKVVIKHNKCGHIYEVTPHNFLDGGNRCPKCGNYKGEIETERVLKELNINYESQYIFDDLLSDLGNPLRFDFAIFDRNNNLSFLYEYDGEFHYKKIYKDHDFEGQVYRDNLKNKYCKQNNIDLLRIPYWEFDSIEEILTDKLKEKGLI